jgi:predicted Zn finger-like uncharacterized protein
MILTCDNCHARYIVPAHAIGSGGRRVRCAHCRHEWVQPEDEDDGSGVDFSSVLADVEPIPESVRPMAEGSSVPSLMTDPHPADTTAARIAGYAAAACVILALLAATIPLRSNIVSLWPPAAGFYALLHLETPMPGRGLVFDHVQAKSGVSAEGVRIIRLDGRIINLRSVPVKVPAIGASLKLADGKELDRWIVPRTEEVLKAQGDMTFSTSYPLPKGAVKDATVGFVLKP